MPPDPNRQAVFEALTARTLYQGEVTFPCVPAALEHYVTHLEGLFEKLGKPLAPHEISRVRELLDQNLRDGYRQGGGSLVLVQYQVTSSPTLKKNLAVRAGLRVSTLAQQYVAWVEKRNDVLFGTNPDARVMAELAALRDPQGAVLDVGAGSGRNALPIARSGHPVDAVEVSPEFCDMLEKTIKDSKLPVRVIRGDLHDPRTVIPAGKYTLAIATEVVSHFRYGPWLRDFMMRMGEVLRPGGRLLFNIFLPRAGYVPDTLAREMSEVAWATLFTREEVDAARSGLPLRLIGDDSVYDYEKAHLPPNAWPPTSWFEAWSRGWSIFPLADGQTAPVEMRWLLMERT